MPNDSLLGTNSEPEQTTEIKPWTLKVTKRSHVTARWWSLYSVLLF